MSDQQSPIAIKGRTLGSDLAAPTPNNTPSVAAPISSLRMPSGAPAIPEEPATVTTTAPAATAGSAPAASSARPGDLFAPNTQLVSMLQGRLGSLVNAPSGYVETLPRAVRRRILALKGLHREQLDLEKAFHTEVLELEKKYAALYAPKFARRAELVSGVEEASEAEVTAGQVADPEDKLDEAAAGGDDEGSAPRGIPEFWLTAFKNHPLLVETITERDEEALAHLRNVRLVYLDGAPTSDAEDKSSGFHLEFEFDAANPCFSDTLLTKTYFYKFSDNLGDLVFSSSSGCPIHWNEGKDLTVTTQTKRQRNKVTKQERVVTTTVPCESFFDFFKPPQPPADDDSDADDDDDDEEALERREMLMAKLEEDYELGEEFKDKLIPHAIDWFTGKALDYEGIDMEDDDEYSDSDDSDDDLSE